MSFNEIEKNKITTKALADFKKLAYSLNPIPDKEWLFYERNLSLKFIKSGSYYLAPGEPANIYAFVHTGIFKRYYLDSDGRQIIFSFDGPGRVISDLPSLLRGQPASMHVKCIKDSYVLTTKPNFYLELRDRHRCFQENARRITELRYLEFVDRSLDLLTLSATQRYHKFLNSNADILVHLEKKDIAAFLGITPESLSRVIKLARTEASKNN